MTNQEVIEECKKALAIADRNDERYIDLLITIIKALEQEPCEDAISRQAVLEQLDVYCKNNCKYTEAEQDVMCRACDTGSCIELIEDMPSVTPEKPKAHNCNNDYADCDQFVCSKCGIELQDWHRVEHDEDTWEEEFYEYAFRYCPNCGAKIEVEEMEAEE